MLEPIAAAITSATGTPLGSLTSRPVSGGCISRASVITDGTHTYFLKLNCPAFVENFIAESAALTGIAKTRTVRVPAPICHGTTPTSSYLVLEYLSLTGPAKATLGTTLAALHQHTSADQRFGWHRDNFIGTTPQPNPWTRSWADFFTTHRLAHQLDLAAGNGHTFSRVTGLLESVRSKLTNHHPPPSLLHGDLWSGNAASSTGGTPVVFDPATYYGDRETDLAFTHLFGGFPGAFHTAYHSAYPLPDGHRSRRRIYNLYHLLNHHNLFAGHYTAAAQQSIDSLLA